MQRSFSLFAASRLTLLCFSNTSTTPGAREARIGYELAGEAKQFCCVQKAKRGDACCTSLRLVSGRSMEEEVV